MKKILILHGRGGYDKENWFPWLKEKLEKSEMGVFAPNLPNTNIPVFEEQLDYLEKFKNEFKEGDFIVGHSLGCKLALHFIERYKLKGLNVILVAPVYPGLGEELGKKTFGDAFESISKYFDKNLDFTKLGNKYIIFLSEDDPYVNLNNAKNYLKQLENASFISFKNRGHFNTSSGVTEFEELLPFFTQEINKEKYNNWNNLKQDINYSELKNFYVKEKQVWYIHSGVNIGFESNGKGEDFKRPVLVIKKIGGLFFIVSMTTKGKKNNKYYYELDKSYFNKESYVVLSQVKSIDKKRFFEQLGEISGEDFKKIQKELQNLLF